MSGAAKMGRRVGFGLTTVIALVLWLVLLAAGARQGWWHAMPAPRDDAAGFLQWAETRYAAKSKGDIAMALLVHGHVAGSYFASHGRAVDETSLFQVASMSKWLTACGVMALAEQHRIELDAPVSRYLARWHLPPGDFDNDGVTVRRLLAHTAGLTDGLGFLGYPPDRIPPSIEQELTHTEDVMPGANGIVRVGARPGTRWRYSGGGYLILQLLIEEVTQAPFNDFMRQTVFQPLGMTESTFVDPDPARLADVFDADGSKVAAAKFTALGAASLYTSLADMTRFLEAQLAGSGSVLKPATLEAMRAPQAYLYGIPVWGLGETLYVPNGAGGYVIGHDGNNYPAINTTARIDPAAGDGILVLETGNATLAREIGGEWTYWRTGTVALDTLVLFELRSLLIVFASGAIVILIAGILIARRRRVS